MPPAIQVTNLTRRLPSGDKTLTILDDVSFTIDHGQFVAIVGRSGSGKSTLLALMAGLDRPTLGSVLIDGDAIERKSEDALALLRREKIGFVFQSFHLLPNLTAHENVMLPLELIQNRGGSSPRARAAELLAQVGLKERLHHYPTQLSGGEQQRVALARAFAASPKMLLADEPTGNLDSENGAKVMEILVELRRAHQTTLVLVTHDQAVAGRADRRIFLADGRVVSDEGISKPGALAPDLARGN